MVVAEGEVVRLVQVTLRTFYEPKFAVVLDQLVRKEAMRDEELAARIGINTRDLGKLANKLAEDGFLATHRRNELRPGAMKATSRTWYYIDYQRTIDNIKWRMFKIRKDIEDKLRHEQDSQGYVCPRCKKRFTTLDAGALHDFTTNTMKCDVCQADVVDNENLAEVQRGKVKMKRLLEQTKPIVDGLVKTETLRLSAFDIAAWLEKHVPVASGDLLPTAGGSAPAKVTIELVDESTDGVERAKREAEAEAKRTQNALPSWIERSTITGELTSVGAAQSGKGANGIEITADKDGPASPTKGSGNADDDTDAYYANLAAAQAAVTQAAQAKDGHSHASPSGSTLQNASRLADSGYEDLGGSASRSASPALNASTSSTQQQQPRKNKPKKPKHKRTESLKPPPPTDVAPLSTTSSLGKRSRAPSEDSEGSKKSRTAEHTPAASSVTTPVMSQAPAMSKTPSLVGQEVEPLANAEQSAETGVEVFEVVGEEEEGGDDPILTVNGKEMPFSQITEDMTLEMTPEEYTVYFETMAAYG